MSADMASFLQAAIGTILVCAAVAKVLSGGSLRPFLVATGFSRTTSGLISHLAPPLEGLVGALLLSGVALPAAAATALSLAFFAVLIVAWRRGVDEGCRCFGSLDPSRLSGWPVARAGLLLAGTVLLSSVYAASGWPVWVGIWQEPSVVFAVLGALAGVGYVVAFALLEQIRHFQRRRPRRLPAPRRGVA
jgi:hypothetical protein